MVNDAPLRVLEAGSDRQRAAGEGASGRLRRGRVLGPEVLIVVAAGVGAGGADGR